MANKKELEALNRELQEDLKRATEHLENQQIELTRLRASSLILAASRIEAEEEKADVVEVQHEIEIELVKSQNELESIKVDAKYTAAKDDAVATLLALLIRGK